MIINKTFKGLIIVCLLFQNSAGAQNAEAPADPFAGVTYTAQEKAKQHEEADKIIRAFIATQARLKWGDNEAIAAAQIKEQTGAYERVAKLKKDGLPGFDEATLKRVIEAADKQDKTHFDFVYQLALIKKALPDPATAKLPTLTIRGKEYKDVTIIKATSVDLRIMHASGTAAIPLADLPEDIREMYRFDPAGLHPEAEERDAAQAKYRATLSAEKQKIAERDRDYSKRDELRGQIAKTGVNVRVRITQVLPKSGVALGYGSAVRKATLTDYDLRPGKIVNGMILEPEADDPICIVGLPSSFVDGDSWSGWLYPCGSYSYGAVSGAVKTVRKYGATAEAAEKELSKP